MADQKKVELCCLLLTDAMHELKLTASHLETGAKTLLAIGEIEEEEYADELQQVEAARASGKAIEEFLANG